MEAAHGGQPPLLGGETPNLLAIRRKSGQAVDESCQTAFQVGRLVLVNAAPLRQLVNHADHFGQKFTRFRTRFQTAQILDRRTGGLLVVPVLQATLGVLTDTL